MGDEGLAASVHALEDRLVFLVRGVAAKADDGERTPRAELPARLVANPPLEELGEADRLADPRLQPLAAVATEDRPQLERPEASAERRAVLGDVVHLVAGAQVLGDEAERRAQGLGAAGPEQRAIHRREQPLVRVDDERVRALDALLRPARLRADPRGSGVGGVDVEPDACGRTGVGDRGDGIHGGRRGGADGRDDGGRVAQVEFIGAETELVVDRRLPRLEAEQPRRALDR